MQRTFLKAKLHRATITAADPEYEGSITVDRELCKASRIQEYEQVDVLDINNGARFTTYLIYGGPGEIQVNGAAARLVAPGDIAIIIAYCSLSPEKVANHKPRVVLLGPGNKITNAFDHTMREPSENCVVESVSSSPAMPEAIAARMGLVTSAVISCCAEWMAPVFPVVA
jgi:aspartate 1-decarboxylase